MPGGLLSVFAALAAANWLRKPKPAAATAVKLLLGLRLADKARTGDRRQETGDRRQETGDRRQEIILQARQDVRCA